KIDPGFCPGMASLSVKMSLWRSSQTTLHLNLPQREAEQGPLKDGSLSVRIGIMLADGCYCQN
ncbi:MAG: hypothetical protein AAGF01_33290, partial [Cyanobacteria bacterium P01_G01_bin.38]